MRQLFYTLSQIINPGDLDIPQGAAGNDQVKMILQLFFGVAAAAALLIITLAGLKFVLSRGSPDSVAKAKDTIIYALVGLVISLTSFGIVTFVVNRV